jgi:hypothetical protein
MTTFSITLRAFRQPIMLISIMVLFINDHILKIVMPSWITGKLSDFAGLFFFPFLLVAVLAVPLEALGGKPRRIFSWACIFTGLWFSLMKTILPINALTETLASWLVNAPAQIVMDATDLIALPMIWLAWRLWIDEEQKPVLQPIGWRAGLVMIVGAFATLATGYIPEPFVGRLSIVNDKIYAVYDDENTGVNDELAVVVSSDAGRSWQKFDEPPAEIIEALTLPVQLPVVVCSAADASHCYRITGQEEIEETNNGGTTWTIAWHPWNAREDFQMRKTHRLVLEHHTLWNIPIDLAILEDSESTVAIASMKYNGVLVKDQTGEWIPYEVLKASPAPTTIASINEAADFVWPEILMFSILALLELISFLALTRIIVSHLLSASVSGTDRFLTRLRVALPAIGLVVVGIDQLSTKSVFGFGQVMGFASLLYKGDFYPICLPIIWLLSLIVLMPWYQQGVISTRARNIGLLFVGLSIAVLTVLIPSYIFIQWALGSIERYPTAWLWAWGSATVLFVTGSIFVAYLTRRNFLANA